jgi:outer membrane protein TolC
MLFLLVVGINLNAQNDTTYRFTLSEAQEFAIDHYFASENAKLDIEIAKKKVWETTAIGLPQISGDASYQRVLGDIPTFEFDLFSDLGPIFEYQISSLSQLGYPPPQEVSEILNPPATNETDSDEGAIMPRTSITYGVTVSQLIFSGEYIVGLQASKAYKSFSEKNFEKVKIDLKEGIAGTYYGILILNKNQEVLNKTVENLKLNLEHTNKFYEQGLVEETDVDQLALTVKRTENSLRSIENQVKYLTKLFKYQVGLEADGQVELKDDISTLLENNIINPTNYQFSLEEHVDYKLLSTQSELQELSLKREKSQYLPSLSGFYKYSDKTEKGAIDFTIKHMVGLNLSVPIVSSGMRMAKVSQAKMELDKVQKMQEQEAERLKIMAEQSTYDYRTALQNYYNEKENFDLSEKVLNNATVRFTEGLISSLELSLINNQFLQAQLSYASAIQELLKAKTALDKAFSKL